MLCSQVRFVTEPCYCFCHNSLQVTLALPGLNRTLSQMVKGVQEIRKGVSLLWLLGLTAAGAGCTNLGQVPAEQLIGDWQTQLAGFPVRVEYTTANVSIDGQAPVPYVLQGDILRLDQDGQQVRILTFPAKNQMIQRDPMTGTESLFERRR
jgi:hypothetical protein